MTVERVRTKWGRSRFGTGRTPAMALALPGGVVLGAAGGLLAVQTGVAGADPLIGFLVFALCLTMPGTALVYLLVVDRRTIVGAAERPDDSVEAGWYEKAAAGSFTDLILALGITSTVLAFLPEAFVVDLVLVLPAVLVLCAVSFGVRYLVQQGRG